MSTEDADSLQQENNGNTTTTLAFPSDASSAPQWYCFWAFVHQHYQTEYETLINVNNFTDNFLEFLRRTSGAKDNTFLRDTMMNMKAVSQGFAEHEKVRVSAARHTETIADALRDLSPDDDGDEFDRKRNVQNIKVILQDGTTNRAYFLCDQKVSFRHAGNSNKKPRYVQLRKLTQYNERVLVHYSASGSGKSVEAAAGSVTRDAHLAIVLSFDADMKEPDEGDRRNATEQIEKKNNGTMKPAGNGKELLRKEQIERKARSLAAAKAICDQLQTLVDKSSHVIERLSRAAQRNSAPLKVVLAIDEASSCPEIVRCILRDKFIVTGLLEDKLLELADTSPEENLKIQIQITIVGTGVGQSTLGSLPESFVVVPPSHESANVQKQLFDKEIRSLACLSVVSKHRDIPSITSFQHLETCLPVVATLMQNGRMGSIAIAEMKLLESIGGPITEATLVDKIVRRFMLSNGMQSLAIEGKEDSKRAAAALALAVHLFQSKLKTQPPDNPSEFHKWATNMLFDIPINPAVESFGVTVKKLVVTYGLLEPDGAHIESKTGHMISPPLIMAESQQLVAAHMLGVSVAGMLQLSPWRFEVLSTHFVKAVIAASCALTFEERPSLQDALKTIGFNIDLKSTSLSVQKQWKELANRTVVGWEKDDHNLKVASHETMAFAVELRIVEKGGDDEKESDSNKQEGNHLQIDSNAAQVLQRMDEDEVMKTGTGTPKFCTPIAFVNCGNSPLPDGFVTFYAVQKNPDKPEEQQPWEKWTIMIQSKDYFGTSIDASSLNKHAERTRDSALDSVFGTKRLLAVASGHRSLVASLPVKIQREFLPYQLSAEHSTLMKDLLKLMERNEKSRIEKFAIRIPLPDRKRKQPDSDNHM